jgi:hypothetical protein
MPWLAILAVAVCFTAITKTTRPPDCQTTRLASLNHLVGGHGRPIPRRLCVILGYATAAALAGNGTI